MNTRAISGIAQAFLLLVGRFNVGRQSRSKEGSTPQPLATKELNRLLERMNELGAKAVELTMPDTEDLLLRSLADFDVERLRLLLGSGVALSLAIEKWRQRGIWVLCREDPEYPKLLNERMGHNAPPLVYGCGNPDLFQCDGLAIQGSRNASSTVLEYARAIGSRAAEANFSVVTGGARGVDNAGLSGAIDVDGCAIGVLPGGLSRAAIAHENRVPIMEGRLALISPFDPDEGFSVGKAMGRNKLIFALSRAGLAVESDYNRGGTWAGATEQLRRLKFVPIFVRATEPRSLGLEALLREGALPWPDPRNGDATMAQFDELRLINRRDPHNIDNYKATNEPVRQTAMIFDPGEPFEHNEPQATANESADVPPMPSESLFMVVRPIVIDALGNPKSHIQLAEELNLTQKQTREWLSRLVDEGAVLKLSKPVRYVRSE